MIKADKCQSISVSKYKEVKDYRKQAGYSQAKLASEIGVRQATISDWENGVYFPTPENINKMAKLFNVDSVTLENDLRAWFAIKQLQKLNLSKEDVLCMMS